MERLTSIAYVVSQLIGQEDIVKVRPLKRLRLKQLGSKGVAPFRFARSVSWHASC